jgi:hypothetical protein
MKLRLALLIAAMVLAIVAPAHAIIGGQADGSEHGYVAAIQQPDGNDIVFTGVAISPTVVLTVAHGAARVIGRTGSDQARVTFDPVATNSSTWYTGTIHINPGWNPMVPGSGDLAVVTFSSSLPVAPATLPAEGQFGQAQQPTLLATTFNVVAYGVTAFLGGSNGGGQPIPDFSSGGTRKTDREFFLSTDPSWLRFRLPDRDQLCPGDSGGPTLVGNSNLVAGISLGGIGGCASSGSVIDMRLDTPSARAFIGQYVTLP